MAHVVGVPKRDPCQKCALPVFLAERLTVGKQVYHRTCLKCARCGSQLTPGSFYETETDGEFCCETCPDEETILRAEDDVMRRDAASGGVRSSIADRLAFFESSATEDKKLLQKSVSDEEKSLSLKRLNEAAPYKMNAALSSFMNATIEDATDSAGAKIETTSDSDTDGEAEAPPELPASLPPAVLNGTDEIVHTETTPAEHSTLSNIVTKDNSETDAQPGTIESEPVVELRPQPEDAETTNRLSVVRARLQKFEVIANSQPNRPKGSSDVSAAVPNTVGEEPTPTKDNEEVPSVNKSIEGVEDVSKDASERCEEEKDGFKGQLEENVQIIEEKQPVEDEKKEEIVKPAEEESNEVEMMEVVEKDTKEEVQVTVEEEKKDEIPVEMKEETVVEQMDVAEVEKEEVFKENDKKEVEDMEIVKVEEEKVEEIKKEEPKPEEIQIEDSKQEEILEDLPKKEEILEELPKKEEILEELPKQEEILEELSKKEEILEELPKQEEVHPPSEEKVPEIVEKLAEKSEEVEVPTKTTVEKIKKGPRSPKTPKAQEYPDDLNPFGSDDEEEVAQKPTPAPRKISNGSSHSSTKDKDRRKSLNPFDSSDDEIEMDKMKVKPPRPPPPRISKNPFGSESESEVKDEVVEVVPVKTPVPAPRLSKNPTPEPTPRLSKQTFSATTPLNNSGELYGSSASLNTPYSLQRNADGRGSNNSLTSSGGTIRSRKTKKAPAPPPPVRELFPSTETVNSSLKSTPASSACTTPRSQRKKRPAPAPPKPARLEASLHATTPTGSKNSLSHPQSSNLAKLSDEEKVLLEGKTDSQEADAAVEQRLIALDVRIIEDVESSNDIRRKEEDNVVYRRKIIPLDSDEEEDDVTHDRQLEKLKDNKEANNRNRQSQVSIGNDDAEPFYNKSSHGKWKRRKGPAPLLPVPPRKVLQMLPLQEIRHELDIIEVQQQGLEKQGVVLETMIRERCEGKNGELLEDVGGSKTTPNTKEVEDLILQLFELVNEKNELFRRQAELMYLRRQHRLEQEQADLEYEIRVLMAQPERNKTDSDKAREEALIARMVEVVQLRNEVIECLEMDRLREAEEDLSIKQRLELHTANRNEEPSTHTASKLSKKEKKKQKEGKKLGKSKKLDADKDADDTELDTEKLKLKKKRKKFLF